MYVESINLLRVNNLPGRLFWLGALSITAISDSQRRIGCYKKKTTTMSWQFWLSKHFSDDVFLEGNDPLTNSPHHSKFIGKHCVRISFLTYLIKIWWEKNLADQSICQIRRNLAEFIFAEKKNR